MKELSIKQKVTRYDEVLDRAKKELDTCGSLNCDAARQIFRLFPELAESEDEKIRDEICIYIGAKQDISLDVHNRWLSWLERQGEKLPVGFYYVNNEGKKFYSDTFKYGDVTLHVEKQSEKKSADKVEPKFKPNDWIVYYRNDNSREVLQIYDIRDGRYYFTDNVHFSWSVKECDEKAHLWTIQDAKPGDILFHSDSASNGIFIFKELLKYEFSEKVVCYCDYDSEDHFCLGEHHTCCWTDAKILHPATKEQRDLLFSKMKDAGYEWDADKKELKLLITNGGDFDEKNCEQKHFIDIDKMVDDYANNSERGNEEFGRPVPCMVRAYRQGLNDAIRKVVLKPAWSENEMKMLDNLITYLNGSKGLLKETKSIYTDLLKSLKERIKNA